MLLINQIIALTTNQDSPIHANAIAAVEIHFLPLLAFLSSVHDENTRNQQYNMYVRDIVARIPKIQLIDICIRLSAYHKEVV